MYKCTGAHTQGAPRTGSLNEEVKGQTGTLMQKAAVLENFGSSTSLSCPYLCLLKTVPYHLLCANVCHQPEEQRPSSELAQAAPSPAAVLNGMGLSVPLANCPSA